MKTILNTEEIKRIGNKLKTLSQKNNHKETIEEIKKNIKKYPRWADGYSLLGDIYISIAHYEESYSAYSKALELDPDNLQWKLSLLLCQLEIGRDVKHALNELLNLFIKNADDEAICIKIASIMVSGKNPKITIAAIKWRAQNHKNSDVLSGILANQLLEAGLISEGCKIYLNLFDSSPDGVLYAPQLGVALIRIGAFRLAQT